MEMSFSSSIWEGFLEMRSSEKVSQILSGEMTVVVPSSDQPSKAR